MRPVHELFGIAGRNDRRKERERDVNGQNEHSQNRLLAVEKWRDPLRRERTDRRPSRLARFGKLFPNLTYLFRFKLENGYLQRHGYRSPSPCARADRAEHTANRRSDWRLAPPA